MDPIDFAKLVRASTDETFEPGESLVEQGEQTENVRLVIEGEFKVIRDKQVTYNVVEGNFLSETGLHAGLLLPGHIESCCSIVAATKGRTLTWKRSQLVDLLHKEKGLRRALKVTLSWDLIRKLKGQRSILQSGLIDNPDTWTQRRTEQSQHRYTNILQAMLENPEYLQKRKRELEKYRLIHNITDEDHEAALLRNGWTVQGFERGHKERINDEGRGKECDQDDQRNW
eukprot:CAMPEP_0194259328 /NCGR_PEP_ID=MMETSP0158-20130606/43352_1 /TAXON_ID=33649 /ORGANISM="Thalassionema nitzschioides, Strain L26-B" /LENGTH=227 /DNA_ID=CAMNT_0038999091 /DNA_START=479 /DNA_END=1159 /DNA_ORIENTATION=-